MSELIELIELNIRKDALRVAKTYTFKIQGLYYKVTPAMVEQAQAALVSGGDATIILSSPGSEEVLCQFDTVAAFITFLELYEG